MDRVRSTYRDALMFCLVYTLVAWVPAVAGDALCHRGLRSDRVRARRCCAPLRMVGVGGFVFIGALFVSNAAFNNLGRPGRSTLVNWLKDGVLSWPLAAVIGGALSARRV